MALRATDVRLRLDLLSLCRLQLGALDMSVGQGALLHRVGQVLPSVCVHLVPLHRVQCPHVLLSQRSDEMFHSLGACVQCVGHHHRADRCVDQQCLQYHVHFRTRAEEVLGQFQHG